MSDSLPLLFKKERPEKFAFRKERIAIRSFAHKKQAIRTKNHRANSQTRDRGPDEPMADHVRRALEASAEDKSRLYYWLIVLGKLGVCQHFDDNASHPKGAMSQDFFISTFLKQTLLRLLINRLKCFCK